ncbi:MAG: ABC transporter ATP-binding protein [Actinomycetota bacterium]
MARIRLEGLARHYGRTEAVKGIDLEIPDGRFTVLVGPSGCGKTTTLRMVAGLVQPTAGRIWIGERDVTVLEPKERDVAMVFQNYALYPHLRVYDNIAFGLRARSVPGKEIDRRVHRAAELLGVTDLLGRKPGQLSGGQQQRVAIGRAIVRQPAAFLLDEPLSNLDAKLRSDTRTEILRIQRDLGATVLYVTHDQEEAMALSDEIVVMRDGWIEQVGSPGEVYAKPATEFVGTFIGSPTMNIVPGRMEDGRFISEHLVIVGLEGRSGEVRLGIRPDHIHPAGALPEGQATEPFEAVVEVVESLGPRGIVTLRANDLRLRAVVSGRTLASLGEGKATKFVVEREAPHLFRE